VVGIFTETDIRHHKNIRDLVLDPLDGLLHDPVPGKGAGCGSILLVRNSEKQDRRDAQIAAFLDFLDDQINGKLGMSGHGSDGLVNPFAHSGKQRKYKRIHRQTGLPDEPPEKVILPQPSGSIFGKIHMFVTSF
jgi:hypothetical protein